MNGDDGRMSLRLRTIGLSALLATLCLMLSAAGAQAVGRSFWGVANTSSLTGRDFAKMHKARVGVTRINVYQQVIEPTSGVPDFTSSDKLIGDLASRGINALPDLLVSQSNPPPPIGSASKRDKWKQFVRDVVNRYKPGGGYWTGPYQADHPGAKPHPVHFVQVFNEPNLVKYFPSKHPVRDYARLLKISHSAIHGADPRAKVVLAGMAGFADYRGWKFLDRLYRVKGVKRSFNIAAAHPYSRSNYYLKYQMRKFRGVMRKHRDSHTQLWITEFGYGSAHPNGDLNKGLKGQARALKKSFRLLRKERRHWRLHGVVWFQWRDPAHHNPDCTFCSSSGLLHSNLRPKPAYRAFKRFTR